MESIAQTTAFSTVGKTEVNILIPIDIEIDLMERLLLVYYEIDPDSFYMGKRKLLCFPQEAGYQTNKNYHQVPVSCIL
jgi:hypothetical protein